MVDEKNIVAITVRVIDCHLLLECFELYPIFVLDFQR